MQEKKLFVESAKSELYDQLLDSIDEKFELTDDVYTPPAEIIPYLEGRKQASSSDEARRIREVFNQWQDRALMRIVRGRDQAKNVARLLQALPLNFRQGVVTYLRQKLQQGGVEKARGDFVESGQKEETIS